MKKRNRNLNKVSGPGVCQMKQVQDYPVLNRYLAKVFHLAHLQIKSGNHVKSGFMGPEIIVSNLELSADDVGFWLAKVGSYELEDVYASAHYSTKQNSCLSNIITFSLKALDRSDVFVPDNYVLMLSEVTFNVLVSNDGTLSAIEIISDEAKPPGFLKDLVRDFRLKGPANRERIRQQIKRVGTLSDDELFASVCFLDIVTIEV